MEYYIIIIASIIIIVSYFFNRISDKTNIPSVLLLILLGIIGKETANFLGLENQKILNLFEEIKILEVLGTLGLILIVLEASLELKVQKGKSEVIFKSFFIALIGMLICMFSIGGLFMFIYSDMDFHQALIYATPLSVLSSAIVIPSVANLSENLQEFHIYESTFSDILGIMAFYFLIGSDNTTSNSIAIGSFFVSLIFTVAMAVLLSYLLILIFQKLDTKVKLFLMVSILTLLFGIGKLLHLSSLIVILIFGLILNNHKTLFLGILKPYLDMKMVENIRESFLMITIESAFVIRTFFFIIFGFSFVIASIMDTKVILVSLATIIIIYLIRAITFFPFLFSKQALYIAPRGLITLLLYYSIPSSYESANFNPAILLFVIIATCLMMTYGLISKKVTLK